MSAIHGHATEEGTARYRERIAQARASAFRRLGRRWVSPIGLGTYLGDPDAATDRLYEEAIAHAVASGVNLLDTAINYRAQRSERTIGRALARLIRAGEAQRDELVVCTKGGYLPFDGEFPADPTRYVTDTFFATGVLQPDDLVAGCHAISPAYLAHQLAASLKNLGLETIDCYYVHNPEQQLDTVPREKFLVRMEHAFRLLEERARQGAIGCYGVATWQGLREPPEGRSYLSLESLVRLAERVGGPQHHFRAVQAPLNLAMPELYGFRNQRVNGAWMSVLEAAQRLDVAVVTSASLLQARLATLPEGIRRLIPGLETDAQRAVQFARSAPGATAALVGMKRRTHVDEILSVLDRPALLSQEIAQLFDRQAGRRHQQAIG